MMKFLKTFVFVVFMLFLMIWFISLFMPSKVMVTRAMVMHARATTIADAICDLKAWPKWNPVFANSVKKTAVSADSRAVGATLSWQDAGSQYKFTTEEITPTGILLNPVSYTHLDVYKRQGITNIVLPFFFQLCFCNNTIAQAIGEFEFQ